MEQTQQTNQPCCLATWGAGTKKHNALVGTAFASTAILALCSAVLFNIEKLESIRNPLVASVLSNIGLVFIASSWTSLASLTASHLTLGKRTEEAKPWLRWPALSFAAKAIGFGVAGLWVGLLTQGALYPAGRFVGWNNLPRSLMLHLVAGGTFTGIVPATGLAMAYAGRR